MATPLLVIVTGPPGAGKTILARRIAQELGFPYIGKDDIKETLFDTLGWRDREWSQKLGAASFELLFLFVEIELRAGRSLVTETAFWPEYHTARFRELKERYRFKVAQIYCTALAAILFERFQKRAESGERHPGHADHLATCDQFQKFLNVRRYGVLEIDGALLEVDTSHFEQIDYPGLLTALNGYRG